MKNILKSNVVSLLLFALVALVLGGIAFLLYDIPQNTLLQLDNKISLIIAMGLVLANVLVLFILGVNYFLKKKHTAEIMNLALVDEVTGEFSKTKFTLEANKILNKYKAVDNFAMLVMDIDNFKNINDIYDIYKGNEVLKNISGIIKEHLGAKGIFSRLSGDEFAILYKYASEDEVIDFVDNVVKAVSEYPLSVKIVPSFGICYITEHLPITSMFDNARLAKKIIKGTVGIRYLIYSEDLKANSLAEKTIEAEMRDALSDEQFMMYLQPKFDMQTEKVCGAEALVRWQHPEKGLVSPFQFIPLFEKNGFVAEIDKSIWKQAVNSIRAWLDEGLTPVPISVNLSSVHFNSLDLIDVLTSIVNEANIPPEYLELEITESAFFDNTETINDILLELKEKGFKIAVDDFGTGYSSLTMLRFIPVDYLKLDRGFLREASETEKGLKFMKHIIQMSKDLGTKVVSEGIEQLEQVNLLKDLGCDIVQGYYYAKPMPIVDFEQLVYEKVISNNGVEDET